MLFSDKSVANFISRNFEPAWQSVRPVPIVRIDFGNGKIVTRTLHGNIATYVCRANGEVLDVLPGLYEPKTYLQQLGQLQRLSTFAGKSGGAEKLQMYHLRQSQSRAKFGKPEYLNRVSRGTSITGQEIGLKIVLEPERRLESRRLTSPKHARIRPRRIPFQAAIPDKKSLEQDTQTNETVRRRLVHDYLRTNPRATPATMTKWLYREVLKADLDDPYLGLGKLLVGES